MSTTSTTIDGFGRVVIPKAARDRYGLRRGVTVRLEDTASGLLLRAAAPDDMLRVKNGVLVLSAQAATGVEHAVKADRDERDARLRGMARR